MDGPDPRGPALIPITVIVLLLARDLLRQPLPRHAARWPSGLIRRRRAGARISAPCDALVFSPSNQSSTEKRVDDNIARDRHNEGMADPTPTKS